MKTGLLSIFILFTSILYSQNNEPRFYVSANYIYTTTSKLYLQPNSLDQIVRGTHVDLEDIWSYSGEIGFYLSEELNVGLSAEYFKKTYVNANMNLGGIRAVITEGYEVIPVELMLYYKLPFSTGMFNFFMGGGGGLYFGGHIRKIGDVSANTLSKKVGYGIQVAVGAEYMIKKYFGVKIQMRFRDPEFEMKNSYSSKSVNYEGRTILLSSQTFDSKVNIDGISFGFGFIYKF